MTTHEVPDAAPEPVEPVRAAIVLDGPDTLWFTTGTRLVELTGDRLLMADLSARDRAVIRALCEHVQRQLEEPF